MFFSVLTKLFSVLRPFLLVFPLVACMATPTWAQQDNNRNLMPVVVTASRIEQLQKDAIPSASVITSDMIRKKQPADVLTLLRQEAGISIAQSGGPGSQASVFIRGANSNQVLVLIDGVPIRDSSSIGSPMALEHILPDQIERIEIVRGNVSAIYGSGAIGGVIQIFTKRGEGPPSVNLSAGAGSNHTTKLSAGVSGKTEEIRYALGVTRFKTNGFSAMNTSQYPNENPDNDGDRNININAVISREWSKGNEFGARLYAFDAKYEYDGGGYGLPNQKDDGKSREWTAAAFSKNRFTSNWDSTVTLSQAEIKRNTYTRRSAYGDSDYHFKSETSLAQWTNQIVLTPDWIATAGADIAREKADIGEPRKFSRTNHSLYAGLNGKVDNQHFQINARYDHVEKSGSDTAGYLGYGYDLTSSWKLVASASTAFLAPTLYQVYDPYNGNRNLKAERSRSYEAGLQYASGVTLIRGTFFDTRTRDMIDWVSTGGWSGQYFNVGKVKNKGFELNGLTQLAGMDIRGNLTLQDPKDREAGKQLSRRAKTIASLDVSKKLGFWHVGGDIHYEEHRPDGQHRLPAYVLVNLNTRYQISKDISVFARIENLFNRDYQTVYGYNQSDRGFFVGINWKM